MNKDYMLEVSKCKHEWSPNYYKQGHCATEHCKWEEEHCLKCKVFRVKCGCGFENNWSGHSRRRLMKNEQHKLSRAMRNELRKKTLELDTF